MWRLFSLKKKLRDSFRHTTTFGWPLYDLRYYLLNIEPQNLYHEQSSSINNVQRRVVRELQEFGISVINIHDLFPETAFDRLQSSAETLIQQFGEPTVRKKTYHGRDALPGAEKFYLVRLLGMRPVLSAQNEFLGFSLSDEILRIVCSYLDMFCRLLNLEVWCNIPMDGADQFSQRWHRDPDDKKQVKTFLYLRDVDQGTGPFCYIPGTHNGGPQAKVLPQTIEVSNYPPDGAIERLFPLDRRQVCVGKAGTFIFCDTTGFHKGGHALTKSRLLLNSVYMTNAGAVLNQKRFGKFYSIADWTNGTFGSMADYAAGLHVTSHSRTL
jgi:hypothetical protein